MIVSIVVLGSRVCGKRVVAVAFLPVQSSTTACLGAACATYSHTRALLSPALDGRLQARMGGWYKDDGRNGWVADASDGPGSSLSLGLAHDVFALPLLHCQRFNPASASATPPPLWPSLTKVGLLRATDIHPTATLMLRQVARPAPSTISPLLPLCAALSGTMKALRCEECLLQLLCMLCIYCNLLGKMMLSHCSLHRFPNWSAAEQ